MRRFYGLAFAIAALGCDGPQSHEPMAMKLDQAWTYEMRVGMSKRVEPIKVIRLVPVGGVAGFELKGPLGMSHLAWKGTQLLSDMGAHARLYPPLPILDLKRKRTTWHGRVTTVSSPAPANAAIERTEETLVWNTRKVPTIRSTVNLHLPDKDITLDTWFMDGVGIIKQEQRTGVRLDTSILLIGSQ